MHPWILIGAGGFIGAILRYVIGGWVQNSAVTFPLGTLSVNVIGAFFLGFVMYGSEYHGLFGDDVRIFLTIGVLGAFTTMSTFSYESMQLLEEREFLFLAGNVIATVMLTLAAVYLGKIAVTGLWGPIK